MQILLDHTHPDPNQKSAPFQEYVFGTGQLNVFFVFVLFFYPGFMARQDYFTHFEPSQSLGGEKTENPLEKPPDNPQAELGLSHMRPELHVGSNPQW